MNIKDSLDLVHFRMEAIKADRATPDLLPVNLAQLAESIEILEECIRTIARECNVTFTQRMHP